MGETNKMTSIARRINMNFWLKQFSNLILLDIAIVAVVVFAYWSWCEAAVPPGDVISRRYFLGTDAYETFSYVLETESGESISFLISDFLELCRLPAAILAGVEVIILFGSLFGTKEVRHIMKPLNEMAVKAEELSSMPLESHSFEDLQQAIKELNPDIPGAKVTTGDRELQSLAVAINNLLDRMRESYRQQERFVSDASHELRTPIAVIQGYVNMLDRWGKKDEKILNESIEALKNESEQMKNLVEQLLFLARGDSGRNTLHFEEFDLARMVEDVWEESMMIDVEHIYEFNKPEQPVMIKGDIAMLKQSMRILVQNAAKYSQKGDKISLSVSDADGKAKYTVQDEGIGMASSEVVHVFERFYRSDSARNGSQGGTGLGLSIAKWIIDAHGGSVEILSRPDFGTRFTVSL